MVGERVVAANRREPPRVIGDGQRSINELIRFTNHDLRRSAVRLLGLDVAGLDVIAQDIIRPLEDQGGMILEVNAEPWLVFHLLPPYCEHPRPVCEATIESLFPNGRTGRIPLAAITGRGNIAACGRWLAQLLQGSGQRIGWASSTGLYLNDHWLKCGDQTNLTGGRALRSPLNSCRSLSEASLSLSTRQRLGLLGTRPNTAQLIPLDQQHLADAGDLGQLSALLAAVAAWAMHVPAGRIRIWLDDLAAW